MPGDLPATRLPTPGTADSFNAGVRGTGGQVATHLPAIAGDLPAIAMCADIPVAPRAWRWQAGARM